MIVPMQFQSWFASALQLLFPPRCISCQRGGWHLCPHCAQLVDPIGEKICGQCGRPQSTATPKCVSCRMRHTFPLQMVRIAALYTSPLREAVQALKYRHVTEIADPLARYLVVAMSQLARESQLHQGVNSVTGPPIDSVVPVPLHEERRQERGYNQSELLAEALCQRVQLPMQPQWLTRQRATYSQVGLNVLERQENVAQAFVADRAVAGKKIILLDDVYTTGATMHACAEALLTAGAQAIYGLALASPR